MYTRRSVAISLSAAALASILLVAGAARGSTRLATELGKVPQPYQRWVDGARAPTPDVSITLMFQPCPGLPRARGCVFDDGAPAKIYLNLRHLATARVRRYVLLHEIGHYLDFLYLRDRDRDRFRRILGIHAPWRRSRSLPPDFHPTAYTPGPPSEVFAQAYAECAVKGPEIPRRPRRPIRYRYRPTPRQHHRACRLVAAVPMGR